MYWEEIEGWFQWRDAQEEAAGWFPEGSCFVEVGTYLGRSLCSLGDVAKRSGKTFTVIGIDTCRGSGPEGYRQKDYHGAVVAQNGGTFAGVLHKNVIDCGYGDTIGRRSSGRLGMCCLGRSRGQPSSGAGSSGEPTNHASFGPPPSCSIEAAMLVSAS
jgi:hypothetical protein